MKKRTPLTAGRARAARAIRTGEHCPASGWWTPLGSTNYQVGARFIGEGSVMPAVAGGPALWVPRLDG